MKLVSEEGIKGGAEPLAIFFNEISIKCSKLPITLKICQNIATLEIKKGSPKLGLKIKNGEKKH